MEALKKLSVALRDQKGTLEDLKDQRQKVIYHLNLDDKELVKEQIGHFEQRWAQLQSLIDRKIQDSVLTLEDMAQVCVCGGEGSVWKGRRHISGLTYGQLSIYSVLFRWRPV